MTESGKGFILWKFEPYEGEHQFSTADTLEAIVEIRNKALRNSSVYYNYDDFTITSGEIIVPYTK